MRTIPAPPPNRMESLMSIKTKIAALALAALAVTGSLAATTTKAEAYPIKPGATSAPASPPPPSSAPRSPPATAPSTTRLSPLRLGPPLQRVRPVHRQRSRLQLLKRSTEQVELRPARAPHPPRVEPDPPGRPRAGQHFRARVFRAERSGRCCTGVTQGCEPSGATFCTSCYCELLAIKPDDFGAWE